MKNNISFFQLNPTGQRQMNNKENNQNDFVFPLSGIICTFACVPQAFSVSSAIPASPD